MHCKLRAFLANRKQQKRNAMLFSPYLKSGFFYLSINNDCLGWKKTSFVSIFNPKKIKRLYFLKGRGAIDSFMIKKGTEKMNFITKTFVVSKYLNNSSLEQIKHNIDIYLPQLLLPHNSYIDVSLKKNELVTPFVSGNSYFDEEHNSFLLDSILEYALQSMVIKTSDTDALFYVQHGDAYGGNVIWSDEKHFLTIDNEGVGIYPAFYDAFMLISISVETPKEFMDGCNKRIKYFSLFCEKNNIEFDKLFFDKYVSLFVYYRMKSYPEYAKANKHRPFLFLQHSSAKRFFPNSVKLLNKLYNGESDPAFDAIYCKLNDSYGQQ